jgi:hypothetical protein
LAKRAWKKQAGRSPSNDALRDFLRMVHVEVYDFDFGHRHDRQAEADIRSHIVVEPKHAKRAWNTLERVLGRADQSGVCVTAPSLRRALAVDGINLKSPPDYATDIARLNALTTLNLSRLKDHTTLRFGTQATDRIHIPRSEALSALLVATKSGHLLVTGDPGCGKSGMIHRRRNL